MEAAEWIALSAVALGVFGALLGAMWLVVRGQIASAMDHADAAHQRMDSHSNLHSAFREEVAATFGQLRERLASDYVKSEHLRERLSEVLQPILDNQRATNIKLDRMERFNLKMMERLHIPAVLPEEPG